MFSITSFVSCCFFFRKTAAFTLKPSRFDGKLTQKSDTWALGVTCFSSNGGWWDGGPGKGPAGKTCAFWGATQKGWDVGNNVTWCPILKELFDPLYVYIKPSQM